MSETEYIKITWPEVRKGDVLFHENGDRLTVNGFEGLQIRTFAGLYAPSEYRGTGFSPYRRQPEMPAEPGAYLDKDGEVVVLKIVEGVLSWHDGNFWQSEADVEHRAPFTRLVPMPTEERVLGAVASVSPGRYEAMARAVMALFEQEVES